jgi:hypothetical protein
MVHNQTSEQICNWNIFLINLWAESHGSDERHFEVMAEDLACALTNVGLTAVSEET